VANERRGRASPGLSAVLPLALAALASFPPAAGAGAVVLLRSRVLAPYDAAAHGFRAAYREPLEELLLDRRDPDSLAAELGRRRPDVVVAVGLRAALFVRDRLPYTPLVYLAVQDAARHDLVGERITGISADVSPGEVLRALRAIAPRVRRVGVLHGADDGGRELARRARSAAAQAGLALEPVAIPGPALLRDRARELVARTDALWMPADPALARPEVFQYLLKVSMAAGRPLAVFSDALVRRGALLAVIPDYAWTGEMATRAVRRIQAGERAGDIPVAPLGRTLTVVNAATARALGLTPPAESAAMEVLP